MCAYAAGNVEHFKHLMKRLGYVFKKDAWDGSVGTGISYYHNLAKMDEMFSEETLRYHVDMPWMAKPYFYSSDIRGLHRAKSVTIPEKVLCKVIQIKDCRAEAFCSPVGAKYTEDLKDFISYKTNICCL